MTLLHKLALVVHPHPHMTVADQKSKSALDRIDQALDEAEEACERLRVRREGNG